MEFLSGSEPFEYLMDELAVNYHHGKALNPEGGTTYFSALHSTGGHLPGPADVGGDTPNKEEVWKVAKRFNEVQEAILTSGRFDREIFDAFVRHSEDHFVGDVPTCNKGSCLAASLPKYKRRKKSADPTE